MSKSPRWTAREAETELLRNGFSLIRSRGSHRIYEKGGRKVVVPFHSGVSLHPKVVKQVRAAIDEST
jgi:predicted RNA binding protein YcfA (HicA-like mRNA interferase family)